MGLDDSEPFDPLMASGRLPLTKDVASIEALCDAATRGPLLIDNQTTGEGAVVATLPDGRHIVGLAPDASSDDPAATEANARLIRQARCLLLQLLASGSVGSTSGPSCLSGCTRRVATRGERHARRIASIPRCSGVGILPLPLGRGLG